MFAFSWTPRCMMVLRSVTLPAGGGVTTSRTLGEILEHPLLQSLTPPLSVGYVVFHGNSSRFVTESGITDG